MPTATVFVLRLRYVYHFCFSMLCLLADCVGHENNQVWSWSSVSNQSEGLNEFSLVLPHSHMMSQNLWSICKSKQQRQNAAVESEPAESQHLEGKLSYTATDKPVKWPCLKQGHHSQKQHLAAVQLHGKGIQRVHLNKYKHNLDTNKLTMFTALCGDGRPWGNQL